MARPAVRKAVQWEPLDRLLLDQRNFRLPEDSEGSTQGELIELLARDYSLLEIGQSLADNGYFSEEPLIAVSGPREKLTVVEGNRRLAALKLLLSKKLAKRLKLDEWVQLGKQCKYDLSHVPVIEYQDRDSIVPYLGFRHITGVKMWEPFSKARFVDYLVRHRKRTFREVAREIGSRAPTIRSNYAAYRLLVQARDAFDLDTGPAEQNFSVLYLSLSARGVREFIGLDLDRSERALQNPVAKSKADEVSELLLWMFGSKRQSAVLKDSRQLSDFGTILQSKEGLRALRAGADLDNALQISGGEESRLRDNLSRSSFFLDEALRDAHRHTKSKEVELFLIRIFETLNQILRNFPDVRQKAKRDSSA
jgi:hypothetical protein